MRLRPELAAGLSIRPAPMIGPLTSLLPLAISEVSTSLGAGERALFVTTQVQTATGSRIEECGLAG